MTYTAAVHGGWKLAAGLGLVGALAAGGVLLRRQRAAQAAELEQRGKLAQDFSDLEHCLLGAPTPPSELTFKRLLHTSARLDGTPSGWPSDCLGLVDRYRTRVETSGPLEGERSRLSTTLYDLDQTLRHGEVQLIELAAKLSTIWSLSEQLGVARVAPTSNAPPLPAPFAGGAEGARLPFSRFVALEAGASHRFLMWPTKAGALFVCAPTDGGLACSPVAPPEDSFELATPFGTSSSPEHLLVLDGGRHVRRIGGGAVSPRLGSVRDTAHAHVDARGDVLFVTRDSSGPARHRLVTVRADGQRSEAWVGDLLEKLAPKEPRDVTDVSLLGGRVVIARRERPLTRFDFDADKGLSNPVVIDGSPSGSPSTACEDGRCRKLDLGPGPPSRGAGPTLPTLIRDASSDRAGAGEAAAWFARHEAGLIVRGRSHDPATAVLVAADVNQRIDGRDAMLDILNGSSGSEGRRLVFGGENGAVVLAATQEAGVLGVWVDAHGVVSPLRVEGR